MDEIWQRHKTFILQCIVGGLAFLIALIVITNTWSGIAEARTSNAGLKRDLETRVNAGKAPSPASIDGQKKRADDAANAIRAMASKVASQAEGEAYVRENISWIVATVGKPKEDVERFLALYRTLAQVCLTSVREEARSVLVAQAARRGRQIDETLGLAAGVDEPEVPGALHALAVICDVVRRSLDREGIAAVTEIKVNPRNSVDRDLGWVTGVEVRLSVTGDPDDVMGLIRSFNQPDSQMSRMTVLREVESITRRNPDEDVVKANLVLLGLQVKGAQGDDR